MWFSLLCIVLLPCYPAGAARAGGGGVGERRISNANYSCRTKGMWALRRNEVHVSFNHLDTHMYPPTEIGVISTLDKNTVGCVSVKLLACKYSTQRPQREQQ